MANNVPYMNHFQYNYYNNGINYNNYQQYYPNYPNYPINYPINPHYNNNYYTNVNYIPPNNYPNRNNFKNPVKYNNKYRKNIKYTPITIECGVCNLSFKNNLQLEEHINDTHIKCNFEDCTFSGPLEILEIHKLKHIKNENGESLIDSREETLKWINSRKVNFPKSNSSQINTNDKNNGLIKEKSFNKVDYASNQSKVTINTLKDGTNNVETKTESSSEIFPKNSQSMLEIYLRSNMNGKTVNKKPTKSIICPLLNKIYKQPSALIRYTNPFKYEHLLRKMDSLNSPYSFKSSIVEKFATNPARSKDSTSSDGSSLTHQSKGMTKVKKSYNKKYTLYSIPKRPPVYLELIRNDVERLDGLVVEIIRTIQYLKSNEKCVNIKRYSGCVAAVDAMCWIHRSMVSSAVANVRGEASDKFLKFIISMLTLLLSYNITPIMVFDGYEMPAKRAENAMRRERREKAKKEALEMIAKNKNKINTEIMKKCMQAIHITPEVIYRVISVCKKINVAVIVSPFEADAQISYLCRSGIADFAISEDSDLVVYGCPKIVYKLDKEGRGVELNVPFNAVKLTGGGRGRKSSSQSPKSEKSENSEDSQTGSANTNGDVGDNKLEKKVKDGVFKGLNHRMFVAMCVLSGTDYDDGYHINGMGLKVAYRLILEHEHLRGLLKSLYDDTKWSNKLAEYKFDDILLHYENVCKIFLHNIVFDPKNHQLVHINPIGNLDNVTTNKMALLKQEVVEYKLIYDMSSFLINKNVNFINVAKGLVSVADDMEIDYVLTEYDLTVIETVTNKIKYDLYKLPKTGRSPAVGTPTAKSPVKSPNKSPVKSPGKSGNKSPRAGSRSTKTEKSPTKAGGKSPAKSPAKSPSKSPNKSPNKSPKNAVKAEVAAKEVPVKKESLSNGVAQKTKAAKATTKPNAKAKSEKRQLNTKRAVKSLLNGTEAYTVKRARR